MDPSPGGAGSGGAFGPLRRLEAPLRRVFSLDLRSLALFRICVATVYLWDLLDRSRDLTAHYSEAGVLPVAQGVQAFGRGMYLSVYSHVSGSPVGLVVVFVLAGLAGLALLVGYRTRIATLLCWFMLVSLQVRNNYLAEMGGDDFLRLQLLWGIFLPLGAVWSLDARSRPEPRPTSRTVFSIATAALVLQIFTMYFATGVLKSGSRWSDGSALHYALHLFQYETPFTAWLRDQSWLLPPITYATHWFEICGPFLLLIPFRVTALRLVAIASFVGLHTGLAVFLNIGLFPAMAIAAWAAIVPTWFWDVGWPRLRGRAPALDATGPERGEGMATRAPETAARVSVARLPRVARVAVAAMLVYVIGQQVMVLGLVPGAPSNWPRPVVALGRALRINQTWTMFAPDPGGFALWIGVDGWLANGASIDPFRRTPVFAGKPENIPATSRSFRWRQYTWNALLGKPDQPHFKTNHENFARFLCREWNSEHVGGEHLDRLVPVAFVSITGPSGSELQKPYPVLVHDCARGAAQRASAR